MPTTTEPFVIVGAALAGATAAKTLREEGYEGAIRLFGAEEHLPYIRPPDIVLRSRVVRRPAGAALNELSRGAELLLIGDSRRADAQLGSLGAVANDVLLNLSSPTIVVHAPEAARREWVQKREEEPMCSDEPVQGLDRDECRGASATGIPYEACTTPRGERG